MTEDIPPPPPYHKNTHKIIVGVDYGTTFSGVSYVSTTKSDIDDISVITSWPGVGHNSETVYKTPSRIAYPDENPKIKDIKWGFQVDSGMTSYSWTKPLLDKNTRAAEFDDRLLEFQKSSH
ncbi:hypothetical protein FQN57_004985 [Myotisia sp. PD_48]|nr:hypothetical protein FQN57_004985 [Myotisia sp. PD_48]